MMPIIENDLYKYWALAVLLLAILLGYCKGRGAVAASGRSLAWTNFPLIAFALASVGPSVFAIVIYLGYKSGLVQPGPRGYQFSTFIRDLPFDFAILNWGFVAVYVACRLRPNSGSARAAMWTSVVAMSLPNVLLFSLAPTMLSTAFDAGQGIGVIEAVLMFPVIALILPGSGLSLFDPDTGIGLVISALTAPIPFLGLTGWLAGQLIGRAASKAA
jgi:hypothetical protein